LKGVKTINPKSKYKNVNFDEKTGLYKITLNDGTALIWVSYLWGMGKIETMSNMLGATSDVIRKFILLQNRHRIRKAKPKLGIYTAQTDQYGSIYYKKLDKIQNTPVVHSLLENITDHVNDYFENVNRYCINNKAGNKNILIYGEQGTGKTSIIRYLSHKYKDTKSVVFCKDFGAIIRHATNCSKYKVPTIIILEDAEGVLAHNESFVKNFLSGVDTPQNLSGCYTIFTSNYPNKIEKTICNRKGRIDRFFKISKFEKNSEDLKNCIKLYFEKYSTDLKSITSYLSNHRLSGSDIEVLAEESVSLAAKYGSKNVTINIVREMLESFDSELKELKEFSKNEIDYEFNQTKSKIGFTQIQLQPDNPFDEN
jgi:GTPase SAR1 family protein